MTLLVKDIIACLEASNRCSVRFTNASLAVLMQYEWPGNIRELENLVERLLVTITDDTIGPQHLGGYLFDAAFCADALGYSGDPLRHFGCIHGFHWIQCNA
jgi:DNA-binding NtrC family response regulator